MSYWTFVAVCWFFLVGGAGIGWDVASSWHARRLRRLMAKLETSHREGMAELAVLRQFVHHPCAVCKTLDVRATTSVPYRGEN